MSHAAAASALVGAVIALTTSCGSASGPAAGDGGASGDDGSAADHSFGVGSHLRLA